MSTEVTGTKLNINVYNDKSVYDALENPSTSELHFVSENTDNVQFLGYKTSDFSIDCSLGSFISFAVGSSLTITLNAASVIGILRVITLEIVNGGLYTITWPDSIKWIDDISPYLSANGTDVITLYTINNGTIWCGGHIGTYNNE